MPHPGQGDSPAQVESPSAARAEKPSGKRRRRNSGENGARRGVRHLRIGLGACSGCRGGMVTPGFPPVPSMVPLVRVPHALATPDAVASAPGADGTAHRGGSVATQRGQGGPPHVSFFLVLLFLLERPLPWWRGRAYVALSNGVWARVWSAKRRHERRGGVKNRSSPIGPSVGGRGRMR